MSQEHNVEEIAQELHNYGAWLFHNPNAEPLERRAEKNRRAQTILEALHHSYTEEVEQARSDLYEKLTLQLYGMNLNITGKEQKNMFRELEYVYKKTTPNPHSTGLIAMGGEPTTAGFTKEMIKELEERGDTTF